MDPLKKIEETLEFQTKNEDIRITEELMDEIKKEVIRQKITKDTQSLIEAISQEKIPSLQLVPDSKLDQLADSFEIIED